MPNYNAGDIIGKGLVANTIVQLKRIPSDSAPTTFTVKPGQPVGVVYSYISPGANNKSLYWMFKDANGKAYYAEHAEGRFNIAALKDQGVKTEAEQQKEKDKANEGIMPFIERNIKTIAIIAGVALVAKETLPRLFKGGGK